MGEGTPRRYRCRAETTTGTPGPWGLRGSQIRGKGGQGAHIATYQTCREDGLLLAAAPDLLGLLVTAAEALDASERHAESHHVADDIRDYIRRLQLKGAAPPSDDAASHLPDYLLVPLRAYPTAKEVRKAQRGLRVGAFIIRFAGPDIRWAVERSDDLVMSTRRPPAVLSTRARLVGGYESYRHAVAAARVLAGIRRQRRLGGTIFTGFRSGVWVSQDGRHCVAEMHPPPRPNWELYERDTATPLDPERWSAHLTVISRGLSLASLDKAILRARCHAHSESPAPGQGDDA